MTFWEAVRKHRIMDGDAVMSALTRQRSGFGPRDGGAEKGAPGRRKHLTKSGRHNQEPSMERKLVLVGNRHAGVVKDLTCHFLEE